MGLTASKHSGDEVMREKRTYLQMPLADRRRNYHPYRPLSDIPTWLEYYHRDIASRGQEQNPKRIHSIDNVINGKMSVFNGDITELEIDAIVNSASKSVFSKPRGEVNNAISKKAGEYYMDECAMNGLGDAGDAMITGGYKLPARYVVNTLAPKLRDTSTLAKCYRNSLDLAKNEGIRTIAFPCIGVKKKNSFGREKAAKVAMKTVRLWMEKNHTHVDRVIFSVFQVDDLVQYNWLLQEYFPVRTIRQAPSLVPGPQAADRRAPGATAGAVAGASGVSQSTVSTSQVVTAVYDSDDDTPKRRKSIYENNKRFIILQQKAMFMNMSLQAKRSQYLTKTYITLSQIKSWPDYHREDLQSVCASRSRYRASSSINQAVAIWYGNIIELELDALVNSAATRAQGGEVNIAVLDAAGDSYREETEMGSDLKVGEARAVGGYRLPAKHVINTMAPKQSNEVVLAQCYNSSLIVARDSGIKTLAFPCIATRKKNSVDKKRAADIALQATRDWMENNTNCVDLVVFCVYTKDDRAIYEELMQYYFPVTVARPAGYFSTTLSRTDQYDAHSLGPDNRFLPGRFT